MSLFSLPVTSADIVALQQGILFTTTNAADINNQVSSINAPGTTETVASYANQLLASVQATSQMAMGVSALETGANQTVAVLTNLVTNPGVIPAYLNFAASKGLDAGQVVGESLGLAFSGAPGFAALAGLSTGAFAAAVSGTFGINQSFLVSQVQFFVNLYTGISPFPGNPNPTAAQIQSAANGAVFGLAVALNIEGVSTPPSIAVTTQTQVKNALFDIAQSGESPPGQKYVPGLTLPSHPVPTPFQGGPNVTGVFLTQGADTPTTGFATDANGTPKVPPGFTATLPGAVFNALPFVASSGNGNNTLNAGDNLLDTNAAKDGVLNLTTAGFITANPPFAFNVTMAGIGTANITGNAPNGAVTATITGFQGANITDLKVVSDIASTNPVTLGGVGQGLKTALTNVNITGYGGPTNAGLNGAGLTNIAVFDGTIAAAAGAAANTINIGITGPLGGTAAAGGAAGAAGNNGSAAAIRFANDGPNGTAAAPNLSYGTWSIKADSTSNLDLLQGAVGAATNLTLAGAGNIAVGTNGVGNWQLLTTIDESATTGKAIITGASAGGVTHFLASAANPGWLFGSPVGLLNDTGAAFKLTNVKLGTGLAVLDISSATVAQVGALTTVAGTGSPAGNILIVQDAVATGATATTFANIAGFTTLGIGGPTVAQGAAGAINMANLKGFDTLIYMTKAAGAVTVNNGPSTLTVNVNHNTPAGDTALAVNGGTGLADNLTFILGDTTSATPGTVGGIGAGGAITFDGAINGLTATGYENVTIQSNGPAGSANILTGNSLPNQFNATAGAVESLTIAGSEALLSNALFVNGLGGTGVINDNDTGILHIYAAGTNAGGAAFPTLIATNAAAINGATSGGIFMGGSDSQFSTGSVGDIITGSATASNVLMGSVGNDTFTGGSGKDFITTDNGADKIALGAGHTGDVIDLYFGNFTGAFNGGFSATLAGNFGTPVTGLANSITNAADNPVAGTWGVAAAVNADGSPAVNTALDNPFGLFIRTTAANNGTSADQSVVTGFTGGDALQFSSGAWGTGAGNAGLVRGDFVGGGTHIAAGAPADIQTVSAGQTVPVGTNIIELNQVFANANAVALALGNNIGNGGGSYNLHFQAAPTLATLSHFLVAYNDAGGNAHIADVDLFNGVGATGIDSTKDFVVASDMVQLTGVNANTLTNANFHFVA